MLDQQDRHIGGQRGERGQNVVALLLGHAGGGFVEQQHARTAGERQRDLQQPLLAVGERPRRLVVDLGQAEARQQFLDLGDDLGLAGGAPEIPAAALALGDGEAQRFRRRQVREKLVDLKGAGEAEPHAAAGRNRRDVAVLATAPRPRSA